MSPSAPRERALAELFLRTVGIGLMGLAQFGVMSVLAAVLPPIAGAILPVRATDLNVPISTAIFLTFISGMGGAWWAWLRSRVPARSKEAEADQIELSMLRAVVASLPDLIYVKDAQSRFLLANQATARAMGARDGGDLLGKTDFDFYPRGVAESFFNDERKVTRTGESLVGQDEHIRDSDGTTRWILTTKVPLCDGVGRPVGVIGIGRNITALKELEAELRRAHEELEFKATHDYLTGLLNRRAIVEMLDREFERGRRSKAPAGDACTAVLLGDLDHFKNVNDEHGHAVGDQVLREVAERLVRAVRSYDLVGRFGGEEFLVILTNCRAEDALVRANELREAISAGQIKTDRGPIPMTISFGVLATDGRKGVPIERALHDADMALYAAKAAGRNQCRMAEEALMVND
jgi:diguanylate cyclase (GGDEF)-like protein/PAS domain S-box-containing protein